MILFAYWLGVVLGVCALLWVASVFIDWRMMRAEEREKARVVAEFEAWLDSWADRAEDQLAEFDAVAAAAWGREGE